MDSVLLSLIASFLLNVLLFAVKITEKKRELERCVLSPLFVDVDVFSSLKISSLNDNENCIL
jgi:hypothetical protein